MNIVLSSGTHQWKGFVFSAFNFAGLLPSLKFVSSSRSGRDFDCTVSLMLADLAEKGASMSTEETVEKLSTI